MNKSFAAEDLVVGALYVGQESDFGWNQAHAEGIAAMRDAAGVKVVEEERVPETVEVQNSMESMINFDGARLIFATSFGYWDHMLEVAARQPDIQFLHAVPTVWKHGMPENAGRGQAQGLRQRLARIPPQLCRQGRTDAADASAPAEPAQITQAEEALLWLRWLERDDARLLWLRASRRPWKPICWELGISRATVNRRWQYGIAVIVWRLEGRRVPTKRSMTYVIEQA